MPTISTTTNLDQITGYSDGEAYTLNQQANLTIDSDNRYSQNGTILGTISYSSLYDGGINIDARETWWIPFDASSGNVPALSTYGTTDVEVSSVGVGEFLGIWANLGDSAPMTAGTALPTTGYVKLRKKTGTIADDDVLTFTNNSATVTVNSATGGQRGWLLVHAKVGYFVETYNFANYFNMYGDWFELGVSDGSNSQTFQHFCETAPAAVQVETGNGTGVYEWYWNLSSTNYSIYYSSDYLDTSDRSRVYDWNSTGLLTFSNGTLGKVPPNGARIRVPNLAIFAYDSSYNRKLWTDNGYDDTRSWNLEVRGSRGPFNTSTIDCTSGGITTSGYTKPIVKNSCAPNFISVGTEETTMQDCGFAYFSTNNNQSFNISDCLKGTMTKVSWHTYVGNKTSTINNFDDCTWTDCEFFTFNSNVFNNCDNNVFNNCIFGKEQSSSSGVLQITSCNNLTINNSQFYSARSRTGSQKLYSLKFTTCDRMDINNISPTHWRGGVGTHEGINLTTCDNVILRDCGSVGNYVLFGGTQKPFYKGTSANISMSEFNVCTGWEGTGTITTSTSSTTVTGSNITGTGTITTSTSSTTVTGSSTTFATTDLGMVLYDSNLNFIGIIGSYVSPTQVRLEANANVTLSGEPFVITTFASASVGMFLYDFDLNVIGRIATYVSATEVTLEANANVTLSGEPFVITNHPYSSGFPSTNESLYFNDSHGYDQELAWGSVADIENAVLHRGGGTGTFGGRYESDKGTHYGTLVDNKGINPTQLTLCMFFAAQSSRDKSLQSLTLSPTTLKQSGGGLFFENLNDTAIIETVNWVKGATSFKNVNPTRRGGNATNITYTYDLNSGNGYSGTFKALTGANLSSETISPTGFKLKLKAEYTSLSTADFIASPYRFEIFLNTSASDLASNKQGTTESLYLIQNNEPDSLAAFFDNTSGELKYVASEVTTGQISLYPEYYSNAASTIRIRKVGYEVIQLNTTQLIYGETFPIQQAENGIATTTPTATGISVTNHGASPVTWEGKTWSISIVVTDSSSAATIAQYIQYYLGQNSYSLDSTLHNMAYHDMVIPTSTGYETARGQVFGSAGATLKGVRVVDGSGNEIAGFARMQADDGSYYSPAAAYTLTVSNIVSGSRLLLRRTDTLAVISNVTVTSGTFTYTYTHTSDIPVEIVVRKATTSPYYQEWSTTTTLSNSNNTQTANQLSDE